MRQIKTELHQTNGTIRAFQGSGSGTWVLLRCLCVLVSLAVLFCSPAQVASAGTIGRAPATGEERLHRENIEYM